MSLKLFKNKNVFKRESLNKSQEPQLLKPDRAGLLVQDLQLIPNMLLIRAVPKILAFYH
jgi:hypothetical protein